MRHDPSLPANAPELLAGIACHEPACRGKRWRVCGRPGCLAGRLPPRIARLDEVSALASVALPRSNSLPNSHATEEDTDA